MSGSAKIIFLFALTYPRVSLRRRLLAGTLAAWFGPRLLGKLPSLLRLTILVILGWFGTLEVFRKLFPYLERVFAIWGSRNTYTLTKNLWPWHHHSDQIPARLVIGKHDTRPYTYTPLTEPRQIRLLEVAFEDHPKRFTCRLVRENLDTLRTRYLAISYTWGDPSSYSTIPFADGTSMKITKSVSMIMDSLYKKSRSIYVWIDGLCINQDDNDEKSGQIRLMGEIYARAQQVVISLGEPTLESNEAMDFVCRLKVAILHTAATHVGQDRLSFDDIMMAGGFEYSSTSWDALGKLLTRPWFTRVWVVQEVAVGQNPVFICGNRALFWSDLECICIHMQRQGVFFDLISRNLDKREPRFVHPAMALGGLSKMIEARTLKQERQQAKLQDVLLSMFTFDSTDPRDKIFALLGIATDTADASLDPDYTTSAEDIYTRTAAYLLKRDNCILVLHNAGTGLPRKYVDVPSWVPQWVSSFGDDHAVLGQRGYKAAGNTVPSLSFKKADTLAIESILVDTVESVSPERPFGNIDFTAPGYQWTSLCELVKWFREVDVMIKHLRPTRGGLISDHYPNRSYTWDEAYWRTLIGDGASAPAPAVYGDHFKQLRMVMESIFDAGGLESLESILDHDIPFNNELFSSFTSATFGLFCSLMMTTTKNRSLFTTAYGFLGLGNPGTRPGDKICIFGGGSTPFVIRKHTPTSLENSERLWVLVGEAYVHGLMSGEGLEMGTPEEILLV